MCFMLYHQESQTFSESTTTAAYTLHRRETVRTASVVLMSKLLMMDGPKPRLIFTQFQMDCAEF